MLTNIKSIISGGEGITTEFKESKNRLPRTLMESICAFLNRIGGDILLGVKDDGSVTGVNEESISQIKKDFASLMNNPINLFPTAYLTINEYKIDGKTVLHIFVPESSQVHKSNGKIYDRNEDGDFDVTNSVDIIASMYIRKQRAFTENDVYPYATMDDLKPEIIDSVRIMASNRQPNHPWEKMTNDQILRSAGLYQKDIQTGKEGYTLACILLFGKDETIISAIPYHKTDAILRRVNLDRYDDRDDIRCNLIESYDRLMNFVEKHLDDTFYLDDDTRVSVRNKLFREIVANILIHREYSNPYPAKFIIENDRVITENGNKANGFGEIDIDNFTPYPKNPIIAKVFKEIGRADELGSGIKNIKKYCKIYSNSKPIFVEGDVFKTIIPLTSYANPQASAQASAQATAQASVQADESINPLIEFCKTPRTRDEMQHFMKISHRGYFFKRILNPLIEKGLIKLQMPDKPTSPNQKYYS